ncbi:MAG: DUF883 family protein [Steroidobacteraceae bacterium]
MGRSTANESVGGSQTTAFNGTQNESLREELSALAADVEDLIKRAAHLSDDEVSRLKARAREQMAAARDRVDEAAQAMRHRGREAARATDHYVRERPWNAVAIAAGTALVAGWLLRRR